MPRGRPKKVEGTHIVFSDHTSYKFLTDTDTVLASQAANYEDLSSKRKGEFDAYLANFDVSKGDIMYKWKYPYSKSQDYEGQCIFRDNYPAFYFDYDEEDE